MHRIQFATFVLASAILVLTGCKTPPQSFGPEGVQPTPAVVDALLMPLLNKQPQPQVLLVGEQHDAPQHQQLETAVVKSLLRHGRLAAVTLEMAERGRSTQGLKPTADEAQVKEALGWNEAGWPWAAYGPTIMAAVQDDVPVLGANLPRNKQRDAMKNVALDALLTSASLQKQQNLIDEGHCGLLARPQLRPMTRIQIARDQAMAQTLAQAVAAAPLPGVDQARLGKPVVLLLSGNGHVNRALGVPQHLPKSLTVRVVRLLSEGDEPTPEDEETAAGQAPFDATWPTAKRPPKDYCAEFKNSMPSGSVQPQTQP